MTKAAYQYVPGTTVTLLTNPKKMPGHSWSLPARRSCPGKAVSSRPVPEYVYEQKLLPMGAKMTECDECYVQNDKGQFGGNYRRPNVQNAQNVRYAWTLHSLKSEAGQEAWIVYMANAINAQREKHFRWHDSGDMFNVAYIRMVREVVRRTPDVDHWAPTHSWWMPNLLPALRELHSEPNMSVHPSALRMDDPAPVVAGLGAGSTVTTTGVVATGTHICPANSREGDDHGKCMGCRACWAKDIPNAFPIHN